MYNIYMVLKELNIEPTSITKHGTGCFNRPSSLKHNKTGSISFYTKNYKIESRIKASVIITDSNISTENTKTTIVTVDNSKLIFIRILNHCFPSVEKGKIYKGNNVIIHPTATVGYDGFGYVKDEKGKYMRFPHYGNVILGNDTFIDHHVTVNRACFDDTIVDDGTKICHYANIGHNTIIGKNCYITAGVIIAGHAVIGDNVWIGVNASVREGIVVGDNAVIGMGAVVVKDVAANTTVVGNPARVLK